MSRAELEPNDEFVNYQRRIVEHQNYKSLPGKTKDGEITWVRVNHAGRRSWWDQKVTEFQVENRAAVAREIHPPEFLGRKPCKVCGSWKSIFYVYPDQRHRNAINECFPWLELQPYELEISEICDLIFQTDGLDSLHNVLRAFDISASFDYPLEAANIIIQNKRGLSPGVMSNAPDRLDGFHTYNACCRSKADKGRQKSNLSRYADDRRAFENWAEGNWKLANRIMGMYQSSSTEAECPARGCHRVEVMTADHIGPISLGFQHSRYFQPMCSSCNSKKNNRLTLKDIHSLQQLEYEGNTVISWHSSEIWNRLKAQANDEEKARLLSVIMRKNLHIILMSFAQLKNLGANNLLVRYLSPDYSYLDYEFENFDPSTGYFDYSERTSRTKNTESQADRYLRISMESLEKYSSKANRKQLGLWPPFADKSLEKVSTLAHDGYLEEAHNLLLIYISRVADHLID